jgi:protocatechuate 3,4-dioxygenase alpha subunit
MTPSQTIGPFFHFSLTTDPALGRLANGLRLACRVVDGDGAPVTDAMIELWHDGLFGRLPTNEEGVCVFETTKSAYINVSIFARGLLNHLVTRIYFAGEPGNESDAVLALVPEDRQATLMAHPDARDPGLWWFDIRLQGERETVFFDV